MIARNTGRLLYRIQIPVTPANVYDDLVVAKGQNTLAVISATAVSFVDLSSLAIAKAFEQSFAETTHSKPGNLTNRQSARPIRRALSNDPIHRPKLKRRLEFKADIRTP